MSYNSKYFERKPGSLEEAILNAVNGVKTQINEKVTEYIELEFKDKQAAINAYKTINNKVYPGGMQPFSDINQEGNTIQLDKVDNSKKVLGDFKKVGKLKFKVAVEEKLDPVNKKALKKDFDDRKDKDIDNDGDVDSSDKYLAKRRKAVAKAIKKDKNEAYEMGTKEYADHTKKVTPGQTTEDWNKQVNMMQEKNNSMRSVLANMWGVNEGKNPFEKDEEVKSKKEGKTMTGKPMTKVSVDPDMKEKVKTETSIGKKNVK